jgi:hypothetical protein
MGDRGAEGMDRDISMADSAMRNWRGLLAASAFCLVGPEQAHAQQAEPSCRFICELEWKFEPTVTIESLANRHRVVTPEGVIERVNREHVFETILALDMKTKVPRLGFTAELSTAPFSDDNSAELEFEANFYWLTESMSRGWLTSHVDVVNQFSPAERPNATSAYTNKLDFELDTALHLFKRLPEGRWLRGVELETSLDYLATGIPKKGDVLADGTRFADDASHWSLSFVIVIPIAPF